MRSNTVSMIQKTASAAMPDGINRGATKNFLSAVLINSTSATSEINQRKNTNHRLKGEIWVTPDFSRGIRQLYKQRL